MGLIGGCDRLERLCISLLPREPEYFASLLNLVGHSLAKWPNPSQLKQLITSFVCLFLFLDYDGLLVLGGVLLR